MADQNRPESEGNFFNEILSPCELFAARSRSHKIPARGQKDFYPDDSEEQKQRLQQSLDEHWSLISEERVERLGNLVKAIWSPSERIVELQTPAGKFWQTMGFSAEGKQLLLPEEALYLMECGNLQVFHQDLPLSVQDGYEAFLSSDAVSLQQYQVFGHLKRLGFVVHRFDPSSDPSPYARQLNLPRSRDGGGTQLDSPRSRDGRGTQLDSPRSRDGGGTQLDLPRSRDGGGRQLDLPRSRDGGGRQLDLPRSRDGRGTQLDLPRSRDGGGTQLDLPRSRDGGGTQLDLPRSRDGGGRQLKRKRSPTPTSSKTAAKSQAEEMEADDKLPESHLVASAAPQTSSSGAAGEVQARTWWPADVPERQAGQRSAPGSQRWDFSSICFPDMGSAGRLAPPDASLLPGGVEPGVCDVAPWMRRINLRKVKMSAKEEESERRQRRRDVNKDREVQRCRNWAEYHELLERRRAKRQGRPAHLWSGEVQPLHDPTRPISTAELLEKISVIKSTDLLEGAARLKGSEEWRICFNVYQPDSVADFKKSNPGKPFARMCVCCFDGPVPDLQVIKQLSFQSGDVPIVYAAVDHGDISFYTFKDFQLPRDVYP